MRKRIAAALHPKIIRIAGGKCEYCSSDSDFSDSPFDVEHIVPIALGGTSSIDNLALACHGCNLRKSTRITGYDVIIEENVELYNPRKHTWTEHFTWSQDGTLIVGLTPSGRATVEALKLNRTGLVNQRKLLGMLDQ